MAIPTNGLVFYAPLAEDKATAETGQTLTKSGTVNTLKINNIPCSLFASENSNLYANYSGGAFNGTISLWLYATDNTRSDATDYGGFFMLGDFGNFSFIKGCMNTSAENNFAFGSSNSNSSHCYPGTTIIRNEWVHLCFVVSGTSYSIYKNGILASQATAASAITLPDETTLYINNSEVGGIENIAIAACRVYNRALTDSEITELSKEFAGEGTSGGTGVVIDGLFLSTSKPTANQKGLLVNNKFFIPFAESSGGTSAEYYKCASVDTEAKTWSGYKAVFDSTAGTWSFESDVTEGLTYTSVTPVVGSTYSSDGLVMVVLYSSLFYGLLGYYRFNGDADNAVNQEANGVAQNVIYVEGKNGKAVQFDGSTSQVILPKTVSVRGCYQASISVWFKINSLGSKNVIYAEENSLEHFYRFGCEVASDGKVSAYMRNFDSSASSIGITGDTIEFGKWYFLVMKFDAITQSFAMYLDGILVDTKTTTANPIPDTAPARTISVGYFNGTTASDTGVIDGVVDELGIWSRALSDAEVSELYNNGAGKFL